jgi:hypothetical protein
VECGVTFEVALPGRWFLLTVHIYILPASIGLLKVVAECLVHIGDSRVKISAILMEFVRGFPQCSRKNSGIVP